MISVFYSSVEKLNVGEVQTPVLDEAIRAVVPGGFQLIEMGGRHHRQSIMFLTERIRYMSADICILCLLWYTWTDMRLAGRKVYAEAGTEHIGRHYFRQECVFCGQHESCRQLCYSGKVSIQSAIRGFHYKEYYGPIGVFWSYFDRNADAYNQYMRLGRFFINNRNMLPSLMTYTRVALAKIGQGSITWTV